ncbi:ATP-binding protein [Chitinispirillales bacterium ANBcel5]|uniref:ATP-binding protein n=1 Tax=Cellulosispirillum alkaliphilum TaxID=3039283 RepID=UPI002A55CF1C|nr:ATP-binding protein [Chitinispirillales bacterium ANBcel5]
MIQILYPIVLSLGYVYLNFVFELLQKKHNIVYWLSLLLFVVALVIVLNYPPLEPVTLEGLNLVIYVPTQAFVVSIWLAFIVAPGYATYLCIKKLRSTNDLQLKKQIRLVVTGSLLSNTVSLITLSAHLVTDYHILVRFASIGILFDTIFLCLAIRMHHFLCVDVEKLEHSFNLIFDNVHEAVLLLESNGAVIQINRSARKLLGSCAEKYTHKDLQERIKGYRFSDDFNVAPATFTDEFGTHEMLISQSPIKSNDSSLGKLLIMHDVTTQKRAEQQLTRERNLESIGQLAAGIAHDFNNILCGIVSNINLARMEVEHNLNAQQILAQAESTALSARGLTRQILSFSKENTRIDEQFYIKDLISEIAEFTVRGSGVSVSVETDKVPVIVKGDKSQIRQVFQNLIINSIQAMSDGGEIIVKTETVSSNDCLPSNLKPTTYFKASITDHGHGMSEEVKARVFEPFFSTKKSGCGLGLAVAFSVLDNHGGCLTVQSQKGKGTTCTVFIPAQIKELKPPEEDTLLQELKTGSVLIMDDYAPVRLSLSLILKRLGYSVDQAAKGEEALMLYDKKVAQGNTYIAVITDLTVPGAMGGCELARTLLQRDPEMKIIVSSGYSDEAEFNDYKKYGFAAVLHKPYNIKELKKVLLALYPATETACK